MVRKLAQDRLRILMKYCRAGDLLEIGCATGEFLHCAKEAGFKVMGVDSSKLFVEFATRRGLPVRSGRVEDLDFPSASFDAIAMFHLIEHVEQPRPFMAQLNRLLKHSGILLVVTP